MIKIFAFVIFAAIVVVFAAVCVFLLARASYAIYRQYIRESVLDQRFFGRFEDDTRL